MRFTLKDGNLGVRIAHLGNRGVNNAIISRNVDMHEDFDYSNGVRMEMLTNDQKMQFALKEFHIKDLLSCIVPSTPTGYEVTGCSQGQTKTEVDCSVSCAEGYEPDFNNDAFPTMECRSSNTAFTFSGCTSNNSLLISSWLNKKYLLNPSVN